MPDHYIKGYSPKMIGTQQQVSTILQWDSWVELEDYCKKHNINRANWLRELVIRELTKHRARNGTAKKTKQS